jgi:hypothetical protein
MRNKKHLALLLVLGFGISLTYACKYYPRQERLPASANSERRTNRPARNELPPPGSKDLPVPGESPSYAGYHADLFRPLFDNPPPESAPQEPVAPPIPLPPPLLETLNPPDFPVSRKLAAFTYLGQVVEQSRRSIFLKEKGRIFVVKTGEKFGENLEFRLVQITEQEIRIATGELDELIRIPLEKKKALKLDNVDLARAGTAGKHPSPPLPDPPTGETL